MRTSRTMHDKPNTLLMLSNSNNDHDTDSGKL